MNALQDFSTASPVARLFPAFAPPRPPQAPVAAVPSQPVALPLLNCVSAAQLQQHVAADFAAAGDWFTLCRGLRRKGLCLKRRDDDLWVYDASSQAALSSCEDLGIDPDELELRFGPSQPERPSCKAA